MNALIVSGQLQPAVQTTARASSDVSHASSQSERLALVLLWADVKHHLRLKTLCTDMFWQIHTFFLRAARAEKLQFRPSNLQHCLISLQLDAEPMTEHNFNIYL